MLWKHSLMIVVTAVLGSAVTYGVVHSLRTLSVRSAYSDRFPKDPERYVSSTVNTGAQDRLATISQEILSATRLQKIIDEFGLYRNERRKWCRKKSSN